MDGLALTRLVHRPNGPPGIVFTGHFNPQSHRALSNGARACYRKPFNLERLAEIVALVLGKGAHS